MRLGERRLRTPGGGGMAQGGGAPRRSSPRPRPHCCWLPHCPCRPPQAPHCWPPAGGAPGPPHCGQAPPQLSACMPESPSSTKSTFKYWFLCTSRPYRVLRACTASSMLLKVAKAQVRAGRYRMPLGTGPKSPSKASSSLRGTKSSMLPSQRVREARLGGAKATVKFECSCSQRRCMAAAAVALRSAMCATGFPKQVSISIWMMSRCTGCIMRQMASPVRNSGGSLPRTK
mmetsp:Transcript_87301/g.282102  ORF Transcript_87301/g.282102 Transcript_87301/m.282102 type:complete len:230 (+) Transcript_87301:715-1404(+)